MLGNDTMILDHSRYAIRVLVLLALTAGHVIWNLSPGHHYMDDVITPGRMFFPALFPYGVLFFVLSFLFARDRVESGIAVILVSVILLAMLQALAIPTDGDKAHFFYSLRRVLHPETSVAPWVAMGFCPVLAIMGVLRGRERGVRWLALAASASITYVLFAAFYIHSRLQPHFFSSTLKDVIAVMAIGTPVFSGVALVLMWLYAIGPFGERQKGTIEDAQPERGPDG